MNKIFKVIWNEARNAYVVVSEIAKNHGSKSCSTKKLLAMLIATGVMTCASFDVLAEKPVAATTNKSQYVAFKDNSLFQPSNGQTKNLDGYKYVYNRDTKYWVREGYVLTINETGGKYTPLSENAIRADVKYAGTSKPEGILQSVTSRVSETDIVTNSGYRLNEVIAGAFAGVNNGGGTEIPGGWNYIIKDSSWNVSGVEFQEGYADLKSDKLINPSPKGFVTVNSNGKLQWDSDQQVYTYNGEMVNYSNMYVIDGKLGVFTNYGGDKVYTGKVYGKHNEILMTVKDGDKFYSYWGAKVTDPSATMATFPVSEYQENLNVIKKNEEGLLANDIKKVTLDTSKANSAIIGLLRNGDNAVDGAITVTSGGGTGGNDTFVKISNAADTEGKPFATGSKVEVKGPKDAITGIKVNGVDYAINNKVYTAGANVNIDENNVISATDTTYTAGNGIAIDENNGNAISVKLKEGENNLEVTEAGLELKKALTVNSVKAGEFYMSTAGIGYDDKAYITSSGLNANSHKITGVADGVADTDAVNVGQLNAAVQAGNTDTHIKAGEYGVGTDNKVNMQLVDKNGKDAGTVTITDVAKASDVGDVNNIASDIKNKEGKTTVVDAVNNLNNKLDTKVGDLQYSKVEKGDIADGDSTTTAIGKLDQKLTDVAATAAKHTKVEGSKNITVNNTAKEGEAANYKVELNNDIDVNTVKANSVTTGQTVMDKDGLKVGDKVSVSATAVTAGQTSISDEGLAVGPNTSLKADELKVDGKTYIDKNGLNANGMQITNVADGKENSDAVNVGQLKESEKTINNRIDGVENQVISNTNRINQLGNRVNKVGAGAAALAALHPMDFDPDDKLTFSAGYGNYAGENAAAIGAYYRPDEKVMFSVGGTVGNGENMVNAGVSFALDRTNHVSNSRTALAREVIDLRGQLAVMGAKMAKMEKALGMLDETKTKLFPDIPANHWAYEYIAKLAGNGYIEGYPDGNFGGDRLMTRYEFAAMLYRAIENGAALEEKIIKEFEPELGRIRVDRISGEDGDRDKIERVRVNDTKGERDHYGNKLAK